METKKPRYATFKDYLKENYHGPYMATDIVIRHEEDHKKGIVLIERKYPPFGLALPGGMAENIPFYQNAVKEAKEETGLEAMIDNKDKPLCVLSELDQDPREFIATVVYTAKGTGYLKPCKDEDAKSAGIYTEDELRGLLEKDIWAFPHHKKILKIYLEQKIN
jgi:8-oxo-dGTP diphosphatase